MGRAAGDSHAYTWKLQGVRRGTEYVHEQPSVTHIMKSVKDAMGFGGMAWWGFKLGIHASNEELTDDQVDELYEDLKTSDWTPNNVRDTAGERGTGAHDLLEAAALGNVEICPDPHDADELIAQGDPAILAKIAGETKEQWGEHTVMLLDDHLYQAGHWWLEQQENWQVVLTEEPVPSWNYDYCGTLDSGRLYMKTQTLEIVDYKTHKPAQGMHKDGTYREGDGPAYIEDLMQLSAYRESVIEGGLGNPSGTRVVLFSADAVYEDTRTIDFAMFLALKSIHDTICRKCRNRRTRVS